MSRTDKTAVPPPDAIKPAGTVAKVRQDFELDYIGDSSYAVPILLDALDAAERRCAELEGALLRARDDMVCWGAYASPYFQEKWDLAGDLAAIDAALERLPKR